MIETMAAGEIVEINDKMAQVEAGSFRFLVPVEKIERISRSELKKSIKTVQMSFPAGSRSGSEKA